MRYTVTEAKRYLIILVAGSVLILAAEFLGFFTGMDNHCYDLFFRLRGQAEPDNRILIAAIDEITLNRLGRWPLRRIHYAKLLERLDRALIVGLDIIMAEPSEDDALLANAIRKHGRVVLPAYVVKPLQVADAASLLSPYSTGHIHLEQDVDGVVRKIYHTLYAGERQLPSLTSAIHETVTGRRLQRLSPTGEGRDPTTQGRIIQMDAGRINYYGPPGTFPRLSLIDILEGRYPDDFFTGRIVFVGVTAAGLEAGVLTPFTQHRDLMHGVEAHANILCNLIDGNAISEVTFPMRWGVSFGLAFLVLFHFIRTGGLQAALLWVAGIVAVSAASYAAFSAANLWFSPVLLYLFLSFMFVLAYIFRLEQSGRQLNEARLAWEESFNTIDDAIVLMDCEGMTVRMNAAAKARLEPHMLDLLSRKCHMSEEDLRAPSGERRRPPVVEAVAPEAVEIQDPLSDRHYEVKSLPRIDPKKRLIGFVHVVRDITLRKNAERESARLQVQFLQSEKMQSIGRLASGVAHDFNNILMAILGYSELALLSMSKSDPLRDSIQIIHNAGMKATALTRQLLAFSRKQVMELRVVNLKDIVTEMAKILNRVIGEDVTLSLKTEEPLRNILADPVHMEQVLMNLVVNARDAMPRGGAVTIETADVELDEAYTFGRERVTPGSYVMLAVSDTGEGISPEIQTRIFEPFFTTKKVGEGTGMGLSTVYGIVKQMSGHIEVFSEQGKGSVFKVYFPVCPEEAGEKGKADAWVMPRGTENVLIAEDETSLGRLIADILEPLGYRVIIARSGEEALSLAGGSAREIDLLLTDVVMPGMGGKELAETFKSLYPRAKVLFMSGYGGETVVRHGLEQEEGVAFVQKPLVPNRLAQKLREVLDAKGSEPSGDHQRS